jgi:hypothetical protein
MVYHPTPQPSITSAKLLEIEALSSLSTGVVHSGMLGLIESPGPCIKRQEMAFRRLLQTLAPSIREKN